MNLAIRPATDTKVEFGWVSALWYEIYVELVKTLRIPMFTVVTLVFPTLLFAMFGLPNAGAGPDGISAGRFLLASFGTYAVMGVALFSFGVAIAGERGMGWHRLLRASPLRPLSYFVSKIAMAILFGLATLVVLNTVGALAGQIRLGSADWVSLIGLLVAGMVPFVAFGLFLGYVAGPTSAPVIANLIYLPLSFASGLFIPVRNLPEIVQRIAPYLPSYHLAQLGWTYLGLGDKTGMITHLLWLAGYTLLFLALAGWAYRRDEGKAFG